MTEDEQSEILPAAAEEGELVEPRPASNAVEQGRRAAALPAVQAAAAAAGGFVAGAAVVGLVGHRRRRAALLEGARRGRTLARRGSARGGGATERLQIVGSRSLLLDVHLLGGSGANR